MWPSGVHHLHADAPHLQRVVDVGTAIGLEVGPNDTAAIALIEPFTGALVALAIVGQPFGQLQLADGILVAGSALLVQRRDR